MRRRLWSALRLCWCHLFKKPIDIGEKMDLLFTANPDPWRFETSAYEKEKYEKTLSVLPHRQFNHMLEVGCAEGVFTKLLARHGRRLTACDVSTVALERAKERCRDLPGVDFRRLDLAKDHLEGEYDLICAGEVLYFLDDLDCIRRARDKMIGALAAKGSILLCHMRVRREEPDGRGHTPLSGHPTMGATSIHRLFIDETSLRHVCRVSENGYIIDLLCRD